MAGARGTNLQMGGELEDGRQGRYNRDAEGAWNADDIVEPPNYPQAAYHQTCLSMREK